MKFDQFEIKRNVYINWRTNLSWACSHAPQTTSESPQCRVLNGVAKANKAEAKVAFAVVALSRSHF